MSREKLRIANTETDNLLGNLRGEISEIVTCWILMGVNHDSHLSPPKARAQPEALPCLCWNLPFRLSEELNVGMRPYLTGRTAP
jgi:hypothetical protein